MYDITYWISIISDAIFLVGGLVMIPIVWIVLYRLKKIHHNLERIKRNTYWKHE